jgi:hypothetical protein
MAEENQRGLRRHRWVPSGSTAPHAGGDTGGHGPLTDKQFDRASRPRPRALGDEPAT